MICSFDASRAQPFEGLKVFDKSSHEPVIRVDKLVVDGPLADDEFRFPDRERLARKIPIHELVGHGFEPAEVEINKITTAMQVRLAATHPGIRDSLKTPALQRLDWKAIANHDRKASALLRELVPVDRHKNLSGVPVAGVEEAPSRPH